MKPNRLEFLPYHFLLTSVVLMIENSTLKYLQGDGGWLKYQDVSTGQLVSEIRTKLGRCDSMRQNPRNAIIGLGHHNGS